MRIQAVAITKPPKAKAVEVACAPDVSGDVGNLPASNFAHVLGGATGGTTVRETLDALIHSGALQVDPQLRMYVYRASHSGKRWMGLVCAVDTRDFIHLFPHAASTEEISAAQADLEHVHAQLLPGLVCIDSSPDLTYLFVCDTNHRPAYHFVSTDGSTHSAWEVVHPEAYVTALAELAAEEIRGGGAQIIAAHQAGRSPLVILTPDSEIATDRGPLSPRCGLFVLRT